MNKNVTHIASVLGCALVLSSALKSSAAEYAVTIQTAPLTTQALSPNGPFTLDLQLNYGGHSAGNTATINNFSFGGGAATGSPVYNQNASGSLSSTVTMSANAVNAFNEFDQTFNPGTTLSFDVTLSDNPSTPVPDLFAVAILDNGGAQIVTSAPDQLSLAEFNIGNFGTITPAAYAGVNNTDLNNGNEAELGDYSGVTTSISVVPVPEPSSIGILAPGLGIGGLFLMRRKAARA